MRWTRTWSSLLFLALATSLVVPTHAWAADEPAWKQIADDDGIIVWKKSVPGTSFVAFRGRGLVDADIYDVFAVLYDVDHKKELMANCVDYRLLEYRTPGNVIVYNRIGSPFFLISDRDSVIETKVVFEPEHKRIVTSFFKGDDQLMEPPSGVVRTKALQGSWTLQATEDGKTELTYQVMADPGGLLPGWLVNLASRKLPHQTIQNMRSQVKRTQVYKRSRLWVKYLFDFKGLLPVSHPALTRTVEEEAEFLAEFNALKSKQKAQRASSEP